MLTSLNFPVQIQPVNNITPFTYRDGETYLEVLYRLRDYMENTLRPEFNAEMARIIDETNTGLTATGATVTDALEAWETRFTEFMADTVGSIGELNDSAIAGLIGAPSSETAVALNTFIESEIASALAALVGPRVIYPDLAPYNVKFNNDKTPATVTANTAGMQAALDAAAAAGGIVEPPPGTCWVNGDLAIGSRTRVVNAGMDITVWKILDGTSWNNRVFYFKAGAQFSTLEECTTDGNIATRSEFGKMGGVYGTNVSLINSRNCKVINVKSINAAQHCFDATTPYYGSAGDGAIIPGPSEFIDFNGCIADKYGDDGFTTHGSGKIRFENCKALGSRKNMDFSYINSNGFEFDDYSYDITAVNCYSTASAHGFEIKAHGNMSAARNVRLIGCVAEYNEVNFSLRHIEHHKAGTPDSLTARNVQLVGCTSRFPQRVFFGGVDQADGDVPDDQTPAGDNYIGLSVSAYRNVLISNFTHIGDPTFNYAGAPAILFNFKSENIILDGYSISGNTTSDWDVYATGGAQPCRNVMIRNGVHINAGRGAVSTGGEANAKISGLYISRNVPGSPNVGPAIRAYGQKVVRDVRIEPTLPFTYPFNISDVFYSTYETPVAANVTITGPPA